MNKEFIHNKNSTFFYRSLLIVLLICYLRFIPKTILSKITLQVFILTTNAIAFAAHTLRHFHTDLCHNTFQPLFTFGFKFSKSTVARSIGSVQQGYIS